jgi:hypothetical protein
MNGLVEVGFWADRRGGDTSTTSTTTKRQEVEASRRMPQEWVDEDWARENYRMISTCLVPFLRAGYIESYEIGYSWCRFPECSAGGTKELGCATQTNGVFVWPEGFSHYVLKHNVRPPAELVDLAIKDVDKIMAVQRNGRLALSADGTEFEPLPRGTAEFLRAWSTLSDVLD